MRILILGGDGYLGWPTAMDLSSKGHSVHLIDNYCRRKIASQLSCEALINSPDLEKRCDIFKNTFGKVISYSIGDCNDFKFLSSVFKDFCPDTVIHFAEQPSAPYSMLGFNEAKFTLQNNLNTTFNVIWAVMENCPGCHIVKLGTMGEYGTPNIDIEEGWINIKHNGRNDKFLYPRQGGSLYHTTKVLDTDLLWFYVRTFNLKVSDLMQGPVYGLFSESKDKNHHDLLPNFHYDSIFGTVVNRFLTQAVAGVPLTIYGKGGQTRGYLNLIDTLKCIDIAINTSPNPGELRILNQFTEQFTVNELAEKVIQASKLIGKNIEIQNIENPRKEKESHFYNAKNNSFIELGLKPKFMSAEVLAEIMQTIIQYKNKIDINKIMPKNSWS